MTMHTESPEQIEQTIRQTRSEIDETLHALERKFSPQQVVDVAMDYVRGSGEMATNLGRTVRDNPMPLVLIGVGLGWLMFGPRLGRNRHAGYDSDYDYGYEPVSVSHAQGLYGTQPEGVGGSAGSSGGSAGTYGGSLEPGQDSEESEARRRAGSAAGRARGKAQEALHAAGERSEELGERARSAARSAVGQTRARMGEAASRVTRSAADLGSGARHRAERAREGFGHMLHERPLALGALGLAIGAAIALALPATRREDELAGRQRDRLKHRAVEAGQEQLERAQKAAKGATEAARSEAERQHLNLEGGRKAVDKLVEKGQKLAEAAKEGAKKGAREEAGPGGAGASAENASPSASRAPRPGS